jgi:hypothetical protein
MNKAIAVIQSLKDTRELWASTKATSLERINNNN